MKMDRDLKLHTGTALLIYLLFLSSLWEVKISLATKENPFTAKASLIRYWNKQISNNNNPNTSPFILSKASPLSTVDAAFYTKLITQNRLSPHLSAFCSSANLFCFLDSNPTIHTPKKDASFMSYQSRNFVNYNGPRRDMFRSYLTNDVGIANEQFNSYSRGAINHQESFNAYAEDANIGSSNFSSYGDSSLGGSGDFQSYLKGVNVPDLRFSSYDASSNKHKLSFTSYAKFVNSGNQEFISYSKKGNNDQIGFNNYGKESLRLGSLFTGYNELGISGNASFKIYSSDTSTNVDNVFNSYGTGGKKGGIQSFTSYIEDSLGAKDSFESYGRNSNGEKDEFVNYGISFFNGTDTFKEYGKGSMNQQSDFKIYGFVSSFEEYEKKGHASFATYTQAVKNTGSLKADKSEKMGMVKVEEGRFFREYMLREGTIMRMPDIRDKMPKRSFLPRTISSKLPFSTNDLTDVKRLFKAGDNSSLGRLMMNTMTECERVPSKGETKKCVASAEDMIDFAVKVLGHNVMVRTTDNVEGSKKNVVIGKVRGIHSGKVTKSVSCHQSLYPYLVYYCHSVPKVRVYEADILEEESKTKINHGVAICHVDTSAWSPSHGAFVALGSGPGLIEVCHWIFQNDMTWNIADY